MISFRIFYFFHQNNSKLILVDSKEVVIGQ
jgi:hypothetical protein